MRLHTAAPSCVYPGGSSGSALPTGMQSCRRTQPKLRIHRWRKVGDDTLPSPLFMQNLPYCSGQGCYSSLLCLWQQPWEQQEQSSLLCSLLRWQVYPTIHTLPLNLTAASNNLQFLHILCRG